MDIKSMLDYLGELEENNDRQWYHAHKLENKKALETFQDLVADLCHEIGILEDTIIHYKPKDLMYRIPRDTRFTKDKRPYDPSLRAHLSAGGKQMLPLGYYLHVQPGDRTMVACGFHAAGMREATEMIRQYLIAHGSEWEDILFEKDFTENFELLGEKLKNPPRGYEKDHLYIDYLKHKSWFVQAAITDEQVLNPDVFIQTVTASCRIMKPFKDFLNRALSGFVIPERRRF